MVLRSHAKSSGWRTFHLSVCSLRAIVAFCFGAEGFTARLVVGAATFRMDSMFQRMEVLEQELQKLKIEATKSKLPEVGNGVRL